MKCFALLLVISSFAMAAVHGDDVNHNGQEPHNKLFDKIVIARTPLNMLTHPDHVRHYKPHDAMTNKYSKRATIVNKPYYDFNRSQDSKDDIIKKADVDASTSDEVISADRNRRPHHPHHESSSAASAPAATMQTQREALVSSGNPLASCLILVVASCSLVGSILLI
ncbi:MAG: hypothetical protein EXX96DRAFT_583752 [Benjaminiella poitrasii]|nr:MAG: hypothetical protein EXX96DRAFT_583752 [Benjaminiella poitrasii]